MDKAHLKRILVVVAIILAVYPYATTVVPAWRLRVVDEHGSPHVGLQVRQAWKHYSLELEDGRNMEDSWTDKDGYVEFPKRTFRAGLLSRIVRRIITGAFVILHGSLGISADVAAVGPQGRERLDYVPGETPPQQLILPRSAEPEK